MRIALMGGVAVRAIARHRDSPREPPELRARSSRSRRSRRTARWSGATRTMRRRGDRPGRRPRPDPRRGARGERAKLEKILLTHAHIDHAGGTAELARELELPIEGPHPRRPVLDRRPGRAGPHVRLRRAATASCRTAGSTRATGCRSARWSSTCSTARATRPATWCSFRRRIASRSSATCCSPARSAARTFPGGDYDTLIRSIREQAVPARATTCGSCPATGRCRPSAMSAARIRSWATRRWGLREAPAESRRGQRSALRRPRFALLARSSAS